ncbi:hypothetical protein THAOC_02191 [Thalassiosira oceanica]|uniref:Uncharacterized protein n=1 Tax=Thalassiosira oceanica TaxID=159749 RepID=K0TF70_THAOC|nr:hypothetical protein THAOC_02191 [Thalassiosira oceanica]|eukprot:EJK76065.1 hypothetical protein THAOC_02191 [Thalassiosira oceanica]
MNKNIKVLICCEQITSSVYLSGAHRIRIPARISFSKKRYKSIETRYQIRSVDAARIYASTRNAVFSMEVIRFNIIMCSKVV